MYLFVSKTSLLILGFVAHLFMQSGVFAQAIQGQGPYQNYGGSGGGAVGAGIGGVGGGGAIGAGGGLAGGGLVTPGGSTVLRSIDPPPPVQTGTTGIFQSINPLTQNDFQKYVLETTGIKLPLHGSLFFDNLQFVQKSQAPYTVQSISNPFESNSSTASVSSDYILGPGDQLFIRGWGSIEVDVISVVDRNGYINIPKIGSISLAGVKFAHSEKIIYSAINKMYKDFQISVTIGQLKTITIYLVGQARRPGSYSISSGSTLSSALFGTGGPNSSGSLRNIQLKRAGQIVAEFDLYEFLSKGDIPGNIKLIDGDIIVIPPALGYAAIIGKVNNPAVFELKTNNESLDHLLKLSGGFSITADQKLAYLDRLNPRMKPARTIIELFLEGDGLKTQLKNADIIDFQGVPPELANSITIRGNVAHSKRVPWKNGMRISDIIPSRDFLISKESLRRQNEVLFDVFQRERSLRERENIPEDLLDDPLYDVRMDQKSIKEARAKNLVTSEQNLNLTNNNQLNIPITNKQPETKQTNLRIEDAKSIESFREARSTRLFSNQGLVKNNTTTLSDSVGTLYEEINWEYAVIERVNRKNLTTNLIPFNLSKVLDNEKDQENHVLETGDVITIFSINDIRIPVSKKRVIVRVEGEVAKPGIYQVKPDEKLSDVIQKAGGLTHDAYLFGSAFYREEVRKSQSENLEKLLRKLESELSGQLAQASQSLGASSDAALSQARILSAQQAQKQALDRIRNLKPEGRIALGLEPQYLNFINKLPNIRIQNGDRLYIPPRPDFVYIYGAVNTESALIYREGKTVKDYLMLAGVSVGADRDSVILIRADGSALTRSSDWFSSIDGSRVMPGDSIVMPDKLDREASWSSIVRNAKDVTQIFYQLGLGAAGLKALGY